ncbi:hypothetical protein EG829_28255, partial [bacterium]|nr:hypothetical protein [bacterium]
MMKTTSLSGHIIPAFSIMFLLGSVMTFIPDPVAAMPSGKSKSPGPQKETWTFAFYLAGDNSLENEQERNLREICEGGQSLKGVHMVVFFDRDDDVSADNLSTTWQGTRVMIVRGSYRETLKHPLGVDIPESVDAKRFESSIIRAVRNPGDRDLIRKAYEQRGNLFYLKEQNPHARGRIRDILTHDADYLLPLKGREYSNLDATDPSTLKRFMHFVKDSYPADRYLLCVTGHSSGWAARDSTPPAPMKKYSREYSRQLTVNTLKQALLSD